MLKARKLLNFSDRPLFEAPVRGEPLEFGNEIWRQKTRVLGLPDGEEIINNFPPKKVWRRSRDP